jgi:V-type H+-transporting ATPase subunit a
LKATIYPCPETPKERRDMLSGVTSRLDELSTVLDRSMAFRETILKSASINVNTWISRVRKMKAIYHTMNMFRYDQKSMIAECWIPKSEIAKITSTLDIETVTNILSFILLNNFK